MTYDETLGGRRRRALNDMMRFSAFMAIAALVLHVTHIGCPIKFMTGVSCPGCGMTRAWVSLIQGDLHQALAYHPLFWTVPLVMGLYVMDPGTTSIWARAAMIAIAVAFVAVWLLRLNSAHDALILSGGATGPDYISVDKPLWLSWLLGRAAPVLTQVFMV